MNRLDDIAAVLGALHPGDTVCVHTGCAEPLVLTRHLAELAPGLDGVNVLTLMPMGASPYAEAGPARHLVNRSFFPGKGLRKAFADGLVEPLHHRLSEIPGLMRSGAVRADMLLLQVSPPDETGHVSLGLAVDYMKEMLATRPVVIAEINPLMPRTSGDTLVHVSQIAWYLDVDYVPQQVPPTPADSVDVKIAHNVAGLIGDGAVLQVGIGALPDQVLGQLGHLRHLGIHSGIVTDAVRPLIESGVVDNARKTFLPGVSVTTMAAGTQEFYRFLDGNPLVEFHPSSVTHNAAILSGIERLTAVNSGLQADLGGSVNAEVAGGRIVSMIGGLADFAQGATRAPGGASILALRSTFRDGEISNIVPALEGSVPRSLAAADIDFIVTEYGVAPVRAAPPGARAAGLIAIAHPAFRDALAARAEAVG
jgi:acyl-CoA hydrolase